MVRAESIEDVSQIKEKIDRAVVSIFTDFRGLTVSELTDLRKKLRKEEAEYRVVKNTLTKIAIAGENFADIAKILEGPTAVVLGYKDPVTPTKVLFDFAKGNEKIKIKAGIVEKKVADMATLKALSNLPSREVLLAKVVGAIQAPIFGLVYVLSAPIRELVYVLQAISKKKEG